MLTPADFAERLDSWPAGVTLASALEREHREIDEAIDAFLDAPSADGRVESLTAAMRALRRHIFLEEELLFPPLRNAGFVAPVAVMLREHGELWRTMESIERELAEAGDESGLPGQCKMLLAQFERHNSKEEPILYPHAESVLGAPASAELRAFLASGRTPDGWVCAGA